jgi:hypothetical protein
MQVSISATNPHPATRLNRWRPLVISRHREHSYRPRRPTRGAGFGAAALSLYGAGARGCATLTCALGSAVACAAAICFGVALRTLAAATAFGVNGGATLPRGRMGVAMCNTNFHFRVAGAARVTRPGRRYRRAPATTSTSPSGAGAGAPQYCCIASSDAGLRSLRIMGKS